MEKAVVTGGLGFIGSHIAAQLLKDGYAVTILDNSPDRRNISSFGKEVEVISASITNYSLVWEALNDARLVFHEAALVSVPQSVEEPELAYEINVSGTLNVLRAARERGAKRVILASSSAIYGNNHPPLQESMKPDPRSPYARTKLENELQAAAFCEKDALETICLRYFNVYGPGQSANSQYAAVIPKFMAAIKSGKNPLIYGDGTQTRDFVYVKDVVRANILASSAGSSSLGKAFNVASGKPTSLLELLQNLGKISGKKPAPIFKPAREGDIMHSYADTSLAKKGLGFAALWNLGKGLGETFQSFEPST